MRDLPRYVYRRGEDTLYFKRRFRGGWERQWQAEGLTMVSVASYRTEGRRMARVTLMKETDE